MVGFSSTHSAQKKEITKATDFASVAFFMQKSLPLTGSSIKDFLPAYLLIPVLSFSSSASCAVP